MINTFIYSPELVFVEGLTEMSYQTQGTVYKSPSENLRITCVFTNANVDLPLSLSNVEVIATNSDGQDVTADLVDEHEIATDEKSVYVHLKNGEDRGRYLLKVRAETTESKLMEMDLKVRVREPRP